MKKIISLFISLIIIVFSFEVVDAASFTISASSNITKGGTTKLTIKGTDITGRFNITTSNAGVISVSESSVWIENNSYSITLSALSVGSSTITVTPVRPSDSNGNAVSVGSKSLKVNVNNPREKSSDNNLSSLSVDGYTISPEFKKDVLEYKTEVPEGTSKVKIIAKANSAYATVSGAGEKEVKEGTNSFEINVKSETGVTKTYKLLVEVKDNNPIEVTVDGKEYTVVKLRDSYPCEELFNESELTISDFTIPACFNENVGLSLVGLKDSEGNIKSFIYKDEKYIPYNDVKGTSLILILDNVSKKDDFEKAKITIDDNEYDVYKYYNSKRFYIVSAQNIETGEKGYYLYDSKEKVFVLFEIKNLVNSSKLSQKENIYKYISIVFGIGLLLSLIGLLALSKRKNKRNKKDDFLKDDDTADITSLDNKKKEKKKKKKEEKEEKDIKK